MLNLLRPLSLGNRGLTGRSARCCRENKGEERGGRARERERGSEQFGSASPGSKAHHLLWQEREGEPGRLGGEGGSGFPCGDQDAAELWTAPGGAALGAPGCSRFPAPFWNPGDLFPLPSWTPTHRSFLPPSLSERAPEWSGSLASGPVQEAGLRSWKCSPGG